MDLIERGEPFAVLEAKFEQAGVAEGHCILVNGEAGIGKTSLVKAFCREKRDACRIYQGTCDALFTPRPLAPLYDIAMQLGIPFGENDLHLVDRAGLFANFFHEISQQKGTTLIVFEDVHWADEATLDFIKFLARRITRIHCLFILTYRDNDIHSAHPLRNVLGQLAADSFTRLSLAPLSRQAVEKLSLERGYNGEDVFTISGGNPFYVNEILASYSTGVPDNIKDSILTGYNSLDSKTKQVWKLLSVLPMSFEVAYLEKIEPEYAAAIENCLNSRVLIIQEEMISFKHELYRRTIENSLSPLERIALNRKILALFKENFERSNEIERIVHHAKNANEYELVVEFAPLAARKAAQVGAHIEAAKLYLCAIEYYQGEDKNLLVPFYESYAYECYLTNQIKEAVIYTGKALQIWKEKGDKEQEGNTLRLLSRLWWFDGNGKLAGSYARQAIEVFETRPASKAKAMAYSNMSQLKMLANDREECLAWGEKAIAMAKEIHDEGVLCHVLNTVGMAEMDNPENRERGLSLLRESLQLALERSYDEHAARAYVNLASSAVSVKDYPLAKKYLGEGIRYCEEKSLDSRVTYMLSWQSRLMLETGHWEEALQTALTLIRDGKPMPVTRITALVVAASVKMRRGEPDALALLEEAKKMALETMEPQRLVPVQAALLEYEWIMGEGQAGTLRESLPAAGFWERLGCPYEQAMSLFMGQEADKRKALGIVDALGAVAVLEKLKMEMRRSGIKNIPRGIRKSTASNPALLTERELDILSLLKEGMQNKEIAARLFISPKTVDHHISSILFKLDVNSRTKAVQQATQLAILK